LKLRGQIMLPVERWFGSALRCGINWRSSDASERVARAFAPSIGSSGYLMSWWWPASRRRTRGYLTRSGSSAGAFTGIALIWKYRSHDRWRGRRPRIAVKTRQLIREIARANFLWGAPRIHGELLKLGITVSQAYCIAIYAALAENLTRPSQRNQRALFAPII
jgi:hypothetical protein